MWKDVCWGRDRVGGHPRKGVACRGPASDGDATVVSQSRALARLRERERWGGGRGDPGSQIGRRRRRANVGGRWTDGRFGDRS